MTKIKKKNYNQRHIKNDITYLGVSHSLVEWTCTVMLGVGQSYSLEKMY